jgi:nucleotide-binding universal stress UspA family protein
MTGEVNAMFELILLPLDGSALAEEAIPYGVAHAQRFGSELVLLRILDPLPGAGGVSEETLEKASQRSREMALDYLGRLTEHVREAGVTSRVEVVEGRPYREIVRFAEDNDVSLIVISTRGESGLSRWLMGSVADRIVRGARVPVLLIPVRAEEG